AKQFTQRFPDRYIHFTEEDLTDDIYYRVKADKSKSTRSYIKEKLKFELLIADSIDNPVFATLVNGIHVKDGIQFDRIYKLLPTKGYNKKDSKLRIFRHLIIIFKVELINFGTESQTKSKLTGPTFNLSLPHNVSFKGWHFLEELKSIESSDK